jgi:hypothetical protein
MHFFIYFSFKKFSNRHEMLNFKRFHKITIKIPYKMTFCLQGFVQSEFDNININIIVCPM